MRMRVIAASPPTVTQPIVLISPTEPRTNRTNKRARARSLTSSPTVSRAYLRSRTRLPAHKRHTHHTIAHARTPGLRGGLGASIRSGRAGERPTHHGTAARALPRALSRRRQTIDDSPYVDRGKGRGVQCSPVQDITSGFSRLAFCRTYACEKSSPNTSTTSQRRVRGGGRTARARTHARVHSPCVMHLRLVCMWAGTSCFTRGAGDDSHGGGKGGSRHGAPNGWVAEGGPEGTCGDGGRGREASVYSPVKGPRTRDKLYRFLESSVLGGQMGWDARG